MRRTVRAALVAGGVAALGFAVTPAVAEIHDGRAVIGPSLVAADVRGDDGAKARVCEDDGQMTVSHHRGVGVGSSGMGAMHRAHHGEGADAGDDMMGGTDMMGGGSAGDMMGDANRASGGVGRAG